MQRLLALAGGVLSGAAAGTIIALLFTPASGDEMRENLDERKQRALAAGQAAADARRAALEAELAALTHSSLAPESNPALPAGRR